MVVKARTVASAWAKNAECGRRASGTSQQACQGLFADPAESEAGHGDADLNSVENFIELVVELADGARADASFVDELLEARVANADQGVFAGGKKGVGRYQQDHDDDPHEHEGEQKSMAPEKVSGNGF